MTDFNLPRSTQKKEIAVGAPAVAGVFLGAITVAVASAFFSAWVLMLLLGAFASLTGYDTAIGYWASFVSIWIVGIIGQIFNGTISTKSK